MAPAKSSSPPVDIDSQSLWFVEEMYEQYLRDPSSVALDWRHYFERFADDAAKKPRPGEREESRPSPRERREEGEARSLSGAPESLSPAPLPAAKPVGQPDLLTAGPDRRRPSAPERPGSDRRLAFFEKLPLFRHMERSDLAQLADVARERILPPHQPLFREGEWGNELYIVIRGRVVVQRGGSVIAELGEGEVVGELALLDRGPRSADIIAATPVTVLELRGEDMAELLDKRGGLARGMLRVLADRLRRAGSKQEAVDQLVNAYRERGHAQAALDPLGRHFGEPLPELSLEQHGLTEEDLDSLFVARLGGPSQPQSLRNIIDHLRETYCSAIGVQYMHIDAVEVKNWLREQMESTRNRLRLGREEQLRILTKLTDAEVFEDFIHRKFIGAKRFSLQGAESLIPLLDLAVEEAGRRGVQQIVIGMAHRGRLNVLANILGKPAPQIFWEFQDIEPDEGFGRGDVKYHLGYSADRVTASGHNVHLSLCFNPSHLEFVSPVVMGRVRAKQTRIEDVDRRRAMALVIHGDGAFVGQGVVQELFNMSELPGYRTGGAVHVILNNQIGFTTPPEQARSAQYATDVARMLQIPVFHVNGEHPEAVAQVIQLAIDFRETFRKDVVIDMYSYRLYGHNEGDDPTFTQPLLYERIRRQPTVRESYVKNLLQLGQITTSEADEIAVQCRQRLEHHLEEAKHPDYRYAPPSSLGGIWSGFHGGADAGVPEVDTAVDRDRAARLLEQLCDIPESFRAHRKIRRFLGQRQQMARRERPLNWGAAEALAYATLVADGHPVRISGQDAERGTFSHRHAVLHDVETGQRYLPLSQLQGAARFEIYNSPLSETAVLGFEYGFSLDYPEALVVWEAQFGDFCNGAQVIVDQFLTSSEQKWKRLSGLCLFLPHGFEGQGPEHSSARLERFLTLAADDNIQVVNLTTPAQIFHALRRQVLRPWRKPLVVMSPKSLLRHPAAVSTLDAVAGGRFRKVIADDEANPKAGVRRIVLCSGKLFYELHDERQALALDDVALLRLEQVYPIPHQELAAALSAYEPETPVVWVQEEPLNMGAWPFLRLHLGDRIEGDGRHPLSGLARPASASPATGSAAAHKREQRRLIEQALGG